MYVADAKPGLRIDGGDLGALLPVEIKKARGLMTFKVPENIGSVALVLHPTDLRIAQIWALRVDPEFRGRKIASALMGALRREAEGSEIQQIQTYASNERTAHLVGAEFGGRPMKFAKRDHVGNTIEAFPASGIGEVIEWIGECRAEEYPYDPTGSAELKRSSAFIAIDMRAGVPESEIAYAGFVAAGQAGVLA